MTAVKEFLRFTNKSKFSERLGITRQSFHLKLKGESPWSAEEVAIIAKHAGCSMDEAYEELTDTKNEQDAA